MDNNKVDGVFRHIAADLESRGYLPVAEPQHSDFPTVSRSLSHALDLCKRALDLPPEKLEKKMRWLGFVQGVLWVHGGYSIEDLKAMNMPDGEKL